MKQKIKEKFEIRHWLDDIYAVYLKDDKSDNYLFKGTLSEIDAWLSLKQKGFDL